MKFSCVLLLMKVRGQDMVHSQPYTVQCVLPINLYNEFIYVFLWYWMLLVSAVSGFRWVSVRSSLLLTATE